MIKKNLAKTFSLRYRIKNRSLSHKKNKAAKVYHKFPCRLLQNIFISRNFKPLFRQIPKP